MKNDFALALNEVLEDRGLPKEVVVQAIEAAMVSAYRRAVNASSAQHVEAKINPANGDVLIFAEKEVVDDVQDERTEVILSEAKKVDPNTEVGSMVIVESTPKNFGRVAAQTARQVIQQRIREAEREAQFNYYSKQVGEIVTGIVQAINPKGISLGLEMKAEGIIPRNQQIPREHFRVHDRIRALLLEIKTSQRGPQIILSRAHRDFLRRLLENEVPEIYQGLVEIRSISREPGYRSKVAVAALQPGIDPVGACVGIRGVRIQTIVRELNDEKIDVIEWNPDPSIYIAKALSPARVVGVYLDDNITGPKTATVVVPEDQLSLAIGRDGQNARLAAKLTLWRIDIKSLPEAASEVLFKLQNNSEYKIFTRQEEDTIPRVEAILDKKAEGRPVTPEEYHLLSSFVDRIEQGVIQRRKAIRLEHERRLKAAQDAVHEALYELPIFALGLTKKATKALMDEEYENVGDLMLQVFFDESKILEIEGITDKTVKNIHKAYEALTLTLPEPEPAEEQPTEAEEAIEEEQAEEPVEELVAEEAAPEEAGIPEPVAETKDVEPAAEETTIPEDVEEELPESLDEIFQIKPEMLDINSIEDIEEEDDDEDDEEDEDDDERESGGKKRKRRKKRYVDVEYDPDHDVTIYRKKRKRESDDWEDEWDF